MPQIALRNVTVILKMLSVCLMMSLIVSCQNGKKEIEVSADICESAHLLLPPRGMKLTRIDKQFIIANNMHACEECLGYLTNEEQKICEEAE
jgi:hypothetical protein